LAGLNSDSPARWVTWGIAAEYCNWLSEKEGIAKEEWCYEISEKRIDFATKCLAKCGYRLPTQTEWEYACRAGATTSRFFGTSEALLKEYAWCRTTGDGKGPFPVGQLRPSDLGLFDVYGNVSEWCLDQRFSDRRKGRHVPLVDDHIYGFGWSL